MEIKFEDLKYSIKTDTDGCTDEVWSWNGKPHSVDDHPSMIKTLPGSISRAWTHHGERHRVGGPAILTERHFGKTEQFPIRVKHENWFYRGVLHRTDGPAKFSKWNDGEDLMGWFIFGKEYSLDDWGQHPEVDNEKFVYYKLKYA